MNRLVKVVKAKCAKYILTTLLLACSIMIYLPFSSTESSSHLISIDSHCSKSVLQVVNQFDELVVSFRTFGNENATVQYDETAMRLISQRVLNLPDIQDPECPAPIAGKVYENRFLVVKQGKQTIKYLTTSFNEVTIDIESTTYRSNNNVLASESQEKSVIGILKPLVILVDFQDLKGEYDVSTPEFYQRLLFAEGTKSLYDYYLENSYGKLQVKGSVFFRWVTAPQTYSYYEGHYRGMGFYPNNSQKLAEDVIASIDKEVDFSEYDGNNDGIVDGVFIIYAGKKSDANNPYRIYPHQWSINAQKRDGKAISNYTVLPEYRNHPGNTTIGQFCHEFGHMIGAIDLYDLDGLTYQSYDGERSYGIGKWSVMAYGTYGTREVYGDSPSHFDAWHKIKFGWIKPIEITQNIGSISIPAIETSEGQIYKYSPKNNSKEYFLIENRQKIGFDSSIPGEGLIIYHIDESMSSNNYAWYPEKNTSLHYLVSIVQSDGKWDLEKCKNLGDKGDPYSELTDKESISFMLYDGSFSGFSIDHIASENSVINCSFNVKINNSGD